MTITISKSWTQSSPSPSSWVLYLLKWHPNWSQCDPKGMPPIYLRVLIHMMMIIIHIMMIIIYMMMILMHMMMIIINTRMMMMMMMMVVRWISRSTALVAHCCISRHSLCVPHLTIIIVIIITIIIILIIIIIIIITIIINTIITIITIITKTKTKWNDRREN